MTDGEAEFTVVSPQKSAMEWFQVAQRSSAESLHMISVEDSDGNETGTIAVVMRYGTGQQHTVYFKPDRKTN